MPWTSVLSKDVTSSGRFFLSSFDGHLAITVTSTFFFFSAVKSINSFSIVAVDCSSDTSVVIWDLFSLTFWFATFLSFLSRSSRWVWQFYASSVYWYSFCSHDINGFCPLLQDKLVIFFFDDTETEIAAAQGLRFNRLNWLIWLFSSSWSWSWMISRRLQRKTIRLHGSCPFCWWIHVAL